MNIDKLVIHINREGIIQFDIDNNRNVISFEEEIVKKWYLYLKRLIHIWIEKIKWKVDTIIINELRVHCSYNDISICSDDVEFIVINRLWIVAHENLSDITVMKSDVPECSELYVDITNSANNVRLSGFPTLWLSSLPNASKIWRIEITDFSSSKIYLSNIKSGYCSLFNYSDKIETMPLFSVFSSSIDYFEINSTWLIIENLFVLKNSFKSWIWGNLKFNNLRISQTNFFKSSFTNIDFPREKEKFVLIDVNFEWNSFSNIYWWEYFSEIDTEPYLENDERKIKKTPIPFSTMKELYRRLKNEHDSVWNKTEANKFFAKEMEYHMKALKEEKDWKNYWIARLQKEISDFGNDWILASQWYGIVSILWFLFALMGTVYWFRITWELWSTSIYQTFLMYINPLPKVDEVTSLWYLIVSILKILIVYQIIVALRRISQR